MHRKDLQHLCHKFPLNRSCPEPLVLRQNIIKKVTYKKRYWIWHSWFQRVRVNGIRQSGMACLSSFWEHTSWSTKPKAKREITGNDVGLFETSKPKYTHPPTRSPFLIPSKQFHHLRKYLNIQAHRGHSLPKYHRSIDSFCFLEPW